MTARVRLQTVPGKEERDVYVLDVFSVTAQNTHMDIDAKSRSRLTRFFRKAKVRFNFGDIVK